MSGVSSATDVMSRSTVTVPSSPGSGSSAWFRGTEYFAMKAAITASSARRAFTSARSWSLRISHAQCTLWRTPQNASLGCPPGSLTVSCVTARFTAFRASALWHV